MIPISCSGYAFRFSSFKTFFIWRGCIAAVNGMLLSPIEVAKQTGNSVFFEVEWHVWFFYKNETEIPSTVLFRFEMHANSTFIKYQNNLRGEQQLLLPQWLSEFKWTLLEQQSPVTCVVHSKLPQQCDLNIQSISCNCTWKVSNHFSHL